ncbi:Six-hairpin glycosidase-like protein [Cristinia sonorae]|uniref:Six-hairpin glycosidase-like protein n=1 Tax=Cristinia sonorae TaxID=1940300 RepID=A0A8K0UVD8_9AGAR|nr:Six-hairpin glycosidase-like protein [Cristinia sonorae]
MDTGFSRLLILCLLVIPASYVHAQNLSEDQINGVKARLREGAKQSWELGTMAQALIEYDTPSYSVTNGSAVPPPQSNPPTSLDEVFGVTKTVVAGRAKSNGDLTGAQPLIQDGSAADPASLGVAVLLANWTGRGAVDGVDYAQAAEDQLSYLLNQVPRTSDGAISHRVSEVQLWSDFVYMVPPFLAYYGVLANNQSLVSEAYNQIKLYRKYLLDTNANGLWKHIAMGSKIPPDDGHWSTGNGWAAAGMLRVQGTIKNSPLSKKFKNEQKDLSNWVSEILNAMYPHMNSDGLFTNYADNGNTFPDAASAALLASVTYRHALLNKVHKNLPSAEQSRLAISSKNFDSDMWLQPVVNPHSFGQAGSKSPEGQAFVVEMQAAWKDWIAVGAPGANAAGRAVVGAGWTLWAGALGVGYFTIW